MVQQPRCTSRSQGHGRQNPQKLGNTSNIKWLRGIGEYRIDWGPGYRIYLAQDGEALIILFGGSTKKGQQQAIEQAVLLHDEYKSRKKALNLSRKGKKP